MVRSNKLKAVSIISLVIFIFTLMCPIAAFAEEAEEPKDEIAFYVSPDGDDSNDGSIDHPFATVEKARDIIRTLNKDMSCDIVVYLRGGEYKIDKTIVFGVDDSASNGYYITYRNYPGETPILTGAQKIDGWEDIGGIFKTNVGELKFRDFYVNGKHADRARTQSFRIRTWNNPEFYFTIDSTAFTGWENVNVAEVEAVLNTHWVESYTRMGSYTIDGDTAQVRLSSAGRPIFTRLYPENSINQSVHFENSYEFLDQPGEWYLNEANGDLFYIPREGESIEDIHAVIPTIETIIKFEGSDKVNRVKNIKVYGLTFEYTNFLYPIRNNGVIFAQASLIRDNEEILGRVRMPAAIFLESADNIIIERNLLRNLGGSAIDIRSKASNNKIIGNAIIDIAGNGIVEGVFSDDSYGFSHSDPLTWAKGNLISNNYLKRIGTNYYCPTGIVTGYTNSTTIEHNEVSDVAYTAIGVGWGWTSNDTCQGNTKIINNNIYNYSNRNSDAGGIYTLSKTPNSEISGNYIHDADRNEWISYACVRGIYLDQETAGYKVYNNVITRVVERIGVNLVRDNEMYDNDSQDDGIKANAGLKPEYWDIVPQTVRQTSNADWIAEKYGGVRISGEFTSEIDSVTAKIYKNDTPVFVSDPISSSETVVYNLNIDVEKGDIIRFVAERNGEVIEEGISWDSQIKPEIYPRLLLIEDIIFEQRNEEPVKISDATSKALAFADSDTDLTNLSVNIKTPPGTYVVPDPKTITDYSKPVKFRIYSEDEAPYDLAFPEGKKYREWEVSILTTASGNSVKGYNMGEAIADVENWYISGGTKTAGIGSLRFSEGGYSIYRGRTFENELFEFYWNTDTTSAWQSLTFRNQDDTLNPIGSGSACYTVVIKPDEIELQRFNDGIRTVFYGNIGGFTPILGDAITNTYFKDNEDNLIQVGALNTDAGVRLLMYINGQKVFDCIDDGEDKITEPGYFGTYQ
ncbi:MAG TPA: right-handed parallel beta-helix repeat-containing protein, partial [Clostridiaceae bacterium]|nr:right-handed parallel beta-helix repeat-containing protein [Clostridiaceae bacterium]